MNNSTSLKGKQITKEEILEYLKTSTVQDIMDLHASIKEVFNLPDLVAQAPTSSSSAQEEQTEFTVTLKAVDSTQKIPTIKAVRAITGLGLKEAKAAVDNAPSILKENISQQEVDTLKKEFEPLGATLEIK